MCKSCFLIFFLFLCACSQYKMGRGEEMTVSIPYAKGDLSGAFTTELIYAVSAKSPLRYQNDGLYELNVEILENTEETIGYRHDRENSGVVKKNIQASENRSKITAQVFLLQKKTQTILWEKKIQADVCYDYVDQDSLNDLSFINPEGVRIPLLSFSLGQLESSFNAEEASKKNLYQQLAQKIVDAICAEW